MIDTKTANNIYTNVNKCEVQIANLYVMARGERIFAQFHVHRVHLIMFLQTDTRRIEYCF